MIDAKEVHLYYEKLIPFIKEDIVDNVAFSEFSKTKLVEMLGCLGKGDLNTIIVIVENIDGLDRRESRYPVKEKEGLLSLIEAGDVEKVERACADFMAKFALFVAERPEVLKVRLYEFVGSLIDAAIVGGGDENKLNELVAGYFDDTSTTPRIPRSSGNGWRRSRGRSPMWSRVSVKTARNPSSSAR